MKVGAKLENEFDFYKMEENFLKITKEIEAMSDMLEKFEQSIPNIQLFLKYYGSADWFKHLKMEEDGLLSDAKTTSVLGEDYSYDLAIDIANLAKKFKRIGDSLIEK